MKSRNLFRLRALRVSLKIGAAFVVLWLTAQPVAAAEWRGLEPFRSRLTDVERVLGNPQRARSSQPNTLRFQVQGGTVTVAFVTARFVESKGLDPSFEGTVLQIVVQHENSPDTPESLRLVNNSSFEREERRGISRYRNAREGLVYVFRNGRLQTTWYSASAEQMASARRRG